MKIPMKEIVEDCLNSDKSIGLSALTEMLATTFEHIEQESELAKEIKMKIGEIDYTCLMTMLAATFLTTVYANVTFDTEEEIIKYAEERAADFRIEDEGEGCDA